MGKVNIKQIYVVIFTISNEQQLKTIKSEV